MQILAKIVNDPINSSGIFAAGLGLCIWHGLYWHCGIEIPQLALCGQHPKVWLPFVVKSLIRPEDLACVVKPRALGEDNFAIGHLEYHPAIHEFMRVCYDSGFVQSLDWPAWTAEARRYISDPALVASARLA